MIQTLITGDKAYKCVPEEDGLILHMPYVLKTVVHLEHLVDR